MDADSTKDALMTIPTWGLFVIIVLKLVLDWAKERDAKKALDHAPHRDPAKPPTPEEIAAVIRDQQERQEILEQLRMGNTTTQKIADAMEAMSAAQSTIAQSQDRQAQLIERQTQRTRALGESAAQVRELLVRIDDDIKRLKGEVETIRAAIVHHERPPSTRAETAG